jgi:hypothetical protein
MYQTKLRSIDLGKRISSIEQHKASSSAITRGDPYSNFRDVPQFHTTAVEHQNKIYSTDVMMKTYGLMK